jgi:hypothetical protein
MLPSLEDQERQGQGAFQRQLERSIDGSVFDVRYWQIWHFSAVPTAPINVRFQGVISTDRRNTF